MPLATRLLLAVPIAVIGWSAHAGDLSVVGTGDGIDLLRALGAAYTADHPDTNIIVPPSIGSGGGIAAVSSNKEVLARAARPLSDPEKEAAFYTALLGWKVRSNDGNEIVMDMGDLGGVRIRGGYTPPARGQGRGGGGGGGGRGRGGAPGDSAAGPTPTCSRPAT